MPRPDAEGIEARGARAHAERFLAACPEDVRAAARLQYFSGRIDFGSGDYPLTIHFDTTGDFQFWGRNERGSGRYGHIDRLLADYPTPQNRASSTSAANRSHKGQGGKRIEEDSHVSRSSATTGEG